jgi:hypothetical protein
MPPMSAKEEFLKAGAPPAIAERLAPRVGAAPGQRVGGLFGNLAMLRKLLALYQKDGTLVREVIQQVVALVQSGDYLGLLSLAQQRGTEVWAVVQDVIDLFDLNPAPAAAAEFEAPPAA